MNDKNTQPTFPSEREWKEFKNFQQGSYWFGAFIGVVTAALFAMLGWLALHNPSRTQFLIGMVYGVVIAIVASSLPYLARWLVGRRK